jgi:ArsR family transcriptional regulator, cadmium/lead-responsive transcriptional repressor
MGAQPAPGLAGHYEGPHGPGRKPRPFVSWPRRAGSSAPIHLQSCPCGVRSGMRHIHLAADQLFRRPASHGFGRTVQHPGEERWVKSRQHHRQAMRRALARWQARHSRRGAGNEPPGGSTGPPRMVDGPGPIAQEQEDVKQLAGLFGALADPACLQLLELLAAQERTIPECAAHTHLSSGRVRDHLARLEQHGWVTWARHDSYRLTDPKAEELLLLARSLAANNANALVQCHHLGESRPCS